MATTQKPRFLVGRELADEMLSVAQGEDLRCAIAFWSEIGVNEVFSSASPHNVKILCDISMGNTSAEALVALDAPENTNLRHAPGMHAKVIISADGLVVGSANASAAALGEADGPVHNIEAGVFHPPGSPAWKSAIRWFDELFESSPQVKEAQIELARLIFRPKLPATPPRRITAGSLFDLVCAAPWRFSRVGFSFASTLTTKQQKESVRNDVKKAGKVDPKRIDGLKDDGTFCGWDTNDVRRWPEYFFSFWQPKQRLSVYGTRIEAKVLKTGSFMSSTDWRGVQALCDAKLPPRATIAKVDEAMALKLRGEHDGMFYADGFELATAIADIRAGLEAEKNLLKVDTKVVW